MKIQNREIFNRATEIIKKLYGIDARFRPGQYEAIEATILNRRTLVVQRTGWGKSLVYFVCTKLLRERGEGVSLVVSPLLVLMQNQMDAAEKIGLKCDALNNKTADRRDEILNAMVDSNVDMVFVTPETLFRDDVQQRIKDIKIGMFVIDEAHCISDWGHDFRLEYFRLKDVISQLPKTVPILGTTATANDRVVADLKEQFGGDVYVSRGPLSRDSLWIQVLDLPNKVDRYAWILENINKIPGSGIIYCLTQRDCDYLADFLNKNGISARAYYSRSNEADKINTDAEEAFRHNKIKTLVSTIKLGMGYDKGDIAFVIHFQMPKNIVSYYQQIGRAGRNIDKAYVLLMCGKEDERISRYFIDTAFPSEKEARLVIDNLMELEGASADQLCANINIKYSRVTKTLAFLKNDGFIYKEHSKYYVSPKPFYYDKEHFAEITEIRYRELEQMRQIRNTDECYSKYIVSRLDDDTACDCGHCSNCLGRNLISDEGSFAAKQKAAEYIDGMLLKIEPRKKWKVSRVTRDTKIKYINQEGICLSKYGDPGFGELVARGKYSSQERFCDELVGKSAEVLRPLILRENIKYISCVPSLRSKIVMDFTKRLADEMNLQYLELLKKSNSLPQKKMENSSFQCENAFTSFSAIEGASVPKKIILVDDIVDSRWTLTVCGYRLMENGCNEVYPFALADSSQKDD